MSNFLNRPAFYKISFVLAIFLLLFVSAITYRQLETQNRTERLIRDSNRISLELERLFSFVKDAETAQRGYVITKDSMYLVPYFDAQAHIQRTLNRLTTLTSDKPIQSKNQAELSRLVKIRLDAVESVITLVNNNTSNNQLIYNIHLGTEKMYHIRLQMLKMTKREYERLSESSDKHAMNVLLTPLVTIMITFFALVVFVLAFVRINHDAKKMTSLILKESQSKLVEESARAYRRIIQSLPAALYLCDPEGKIIDYNEASVSLWGQKPDKDKAYWCGSNGAFYADGTALNATNNPIARILRGEKVEPDEMVIVRPDGQQRIVIPNPQVLRDDSGNITGALNMYFDITELKANQQKLNESELRLRVATESAGMATWDLDYKTGNLIYSERMNEIFGLPEKSHFNQEQLRSYILEEDRSIIKNATEIAHKTGVYHYIARIKKKTGEIAYIRTDGKLIFDESGNPEQMLGTMIDVTNQKINEQKTLESERLFRTIALNIPNSLVLVFDHEYRVLALDGDLLEKLGYNREDYYGKLISDFTPEDKFLSDKPRYDRVLNNEKFSLEVHDPVQNRQFMTHYVPLRNEDGETYAGLIIALDITDFKMNEERVERLGAIVDSSGDGIISKTLDGIVTSWNAGAEELFGFSEQEMIGSSILKVIPDDRKDEEDRIITAIKSGNKVDHFETRRLKKDGTEFDISLSISPIKDLEGNIIGASKIARDITEQKKAERLLIESEQRFRTLINVAPVLVWMSDTNKVYSFFNKAWLDFTGRSLDEELNNGWTDGIHPDDYHRVLESYQQTFNKQEEFAIEFRLRRFDGEYRWVSDKGVPRYDIDGEFLGYIGGCMDIQDAKDFTKRLEEIVEERTEELVNSNYELIEQKDFAETILDSAIDINIVYDVNMNFLSFNKEAERVYGKQKKDVLGKNLNDIFPGMAGTKGYDDLQRAIGGEMIHNRKYRSDITKLYYEDFLIPLKNNSGEVYAVLVLARNITELITNEELLTSLNESLSSKNSELERSNAELASFNHVASHDLQEPLRKIQTFISRISEGETTGIGDRNLDYLQRIRSSANRMQLLIDDLLTFSRTNKADQLHSDVNLNITLENARKELSQSIEEHNAEIVSTELPTLSGIDFQFHQLFVNLIGNALKYSLADKKVMVTISASVVNGTEIGKEEDKFFHKISFKDNGIGFDQKYADQIFELFQRLHGRTEYTGTGIGLTICKKIVENHNGFIRAFGKPGEGAEFVVYLPKEQV